MCCPAATGDWYVILLGYHVVLWSVWCLACCIFINCYLCVFTAAAFQLVISFVVLWPPSPPMPTITGLDHLRLFLVLGLDNLLFRLNV